MKYIGFLREWNPEQTNFDGKFQNLAFLKEVNVWELWDHAAQNINWKER